MGYFAISRQNIYLYIVQKDRWCPREETVNSMSLIKACPLSLTYRVQTDASYER